jgi:hypothetical protein
MATRTVRHDIMLIIVTALCGAVLTYLFQERAALHREESEQREARRVAATQLFRDIGQLMDRRMFLWGRAYGAFSARLPDTLEQERTYRAAVADWNLSVLTNAALICRYFGSKAGQDFTQTVMPGFAQLDYVLRDFRKGTRSKDSASHQPFHEQRRAVFRFNLELIDLIRSGAVVEGKSPGECSDLRLGPGMTGTTVTAQPRN